jgi:DNA-directed RNA polymerase specialized sigma24 family protein
MKEYIPSVRPDTAYMDCLDLNEEDFRELCRYTASFITRSNAIKTRIDLKDILHETYIDYEQYKSHTVIRIPLHFLKVLARNKICAVLREDKKTTLDINLLENLEPNIVDEFLEDNNISLNSIEINPVILLSILDDIPSEQKKLMMYKYVQRLSYKDIAALYAEEGKTVSVEALRRKICDIKKKLRSLVLSKVSKPMD